jgi:hypothetical protein
LVVTTRAKAAPKKSPPAKGFRAKNAGASPVGHGKAKQGPASRADHRHLTQDNPEGQRRRTDGPVVRPKTTGAKRTAAGQVAAGRLKARAVSGPNVRLTGRSVLAQRGTRSSGLDLPAFARGVSTNFAKGVAQTGAAVNEMGRRFGGVGSSQPNPIRTSIKVGQSDNPLKRQLPKR